MANVPANHRSCPHLGLKTDRTSVFIGPVEEHRCYAVNKPERIDVNHQAAFCLAAAFEACPRFVQPPEQKPKWASAGRADQNLPLVPVDLAVGLPSRFQRWRAAVLERAGLLQWGVWILIAVLAVAVGYGYLKVSRSVTAETIPVVEPTPISIPTPSPLAVKPAATPRPAPKATGIAPKPSVPSPTVSPRPGSSQIALYPPGNAIGWVSSQDPLNHFGDRNLHAGTFEGKTYHGALQFSLTTLPPGAKIEQATLELEALSADSLAANGTWMLQLLGPELDQNWTRTTYEQIHNAPSLGVVPPELTSQDLVPGQVNVFTFTPAQVAELQRRLESGLVSFRLDGPTQVSSNLFTWDTGYGGGFGTRPVLRLVYQLPPTPLPEVVIFTPTPVNVVTIAAIAATATYEATTIGTPTPTPTEFVTATPPIVVTDTPVPENTATSEWVAMVATASSLLSTPPITSFWTATPSPTATATPTYAVVTSTPTPENVLTVVPLAVTATYVATTVGTYTPVPANWITPEVITPVPPPENMATALYMSVLSTAEAIAFGTPTPTPPSIWTATPTPIFILLDGEIPTPLATATATATPQPVPTELVGKIAFMSNRVEGMPPLVYVIDPDGSNLGLLTDPWPYIQSQARDVYSADKRFRVFTKDVTIYKNVGTGAFTIGTPQQVPAVFWYDSLYKVEQQLTHFGNGYAYLGVWSPAAEQIAFVSDDSADDEIWVVNRNGTGLRRLTETNEVYNAQQIGKDTFIPEVNGHPSWSPDGKQIVFWSNRTGHRQIWVMNSDGTGLYSLSRTGFDDWDPVWIKYTDPPP
ncbi:MAG: Protein TolB [Anaerolineae bacterium]|nr:Protein TolB [Anaerolineae bacterium]